MTSVTGALVMHRYISAMKPFHLAALIAATVSYFTFSALIAAPHMFGF